MEQFVENLYPGFVLRHAAGTWRLLDLTHPELPYKKPLQLNESGAFIYERLSSGESVSEIASELSKEFSVPLEDVSKDVEEFVSQLRAYGVPLA